MTQQIRDVVLYDDDQYVLAGWDGAEAPFDPKNFDLKPAMISTACWRGWYAALRIQNRCLVLDSLHIGLPEELLSDVSVEDAPKIFGKPLQRYEYRCQEYCEEKGGMVDKIKLSSEACAKDIGGAILWDGYLLLGSGSRNFGMLAHPAWYYHKIIEFEFVRGVLVGQLDRSIECQNIADWFDTDACPKPPKDPFRSDKKLYKNWQRGLDGLMGALFSGVYCKPKNEEG